MSDSQGHRTNRDGGPTGFSEVRLMESPGLEGYADRNDRNAEPCICIQRR